MTNTTIDFFKKEAKDLLKDWKLGKQEYFAFDLKMVFSICEEFNSKGKPSLMKAQHLLALFLGRKSWSELINEPPKELELTKQAYLKDIKKHFEEWLVQNAFPTLEEMDILLQKDREEFDKNDTTIVECLHCGQIFPKNKPNHLRGCNGQSWDLIPV